MSQQVDVSNNPPRQSPRHSAFCGETRDTYNCEQGALAAGFYYVRVAGYAGAWDESDSYLLRFKVNPQGKGRKTQ